MFIRMSEIMVTVFVLAYNHEKYIKNALDGFILQKTNFKYEVIVHDDASTDHTASIIKEYEEKYPDIIKPIYQTENQYQKGVNKMKLFLLPKAKGKFIAFCEGDDYWSEPNKLQKQYEVMVKYPNCSICFHKTRIISENGNPTNASFPRCDKIKSGIIERNEYLSLVLYTQTLYQLQFHLSSIMIPIEIYKQYIYNLPSYRKEMDVGDLPLFLYMGLHGDAYYIDTEMSCYRSLSVGSWNAQNQDITKKILHLEKEINGLQAFDKYSDYIVHESVEKGINNRRFAIYRISGNLTKMRQMKEFYKMLTYKERLKYYMLYYMPNLCKTLKSIANRRKNYGK